tara:strand:- start:258 stop:617 length:360 start_codon:yes stop_codon:yes gene_type:complete
MLGSILKSAKKTRALDFAAVTITYETDQGTWRGFVMPFDVTFEADTQQEVTDILKEMTDSYMEGLQEHGAPVHLSKVPLSDETDKSKWAEISNEVTNNLLHKVSKFSGNNYYAEAKLPT